MSTTLQDHFDDVKFLVRAFSDSSEVGEYCRKECKSAARWGQFELVVFLVQSIDEPNLRDQCCLEAVEFAACKNYIEIVIFLVQTIVDPNVRDQSCMAAAQSASLKGYLELVKLMVKSMLSLDVKIQCYSKAIAFAILNDHTEIVKFLMETAANEGIDDKCVKKAANYASSNDHLKVVKFLLPHIDNHKKDLSCKMAANLAAGKGHTEMVKYLVSTILNPSVKDQCCIEAAFYAAQISHIELLTHCLTLTDSMIIGQYSVESARRGHLKLANFAMETDERHTIDDQFCHTEANRAASDGHFGKLIFYLLNIADTGVHDQCCIEASEMAASNNQSGIVSFLINDTALERNVKLQCCIKAMEASARNGRTNMLNYLVPTIRGANVRDEFFTNAAEIYARYGHYESVKYVYQTSAHKNLCRTRAVLSAMANDQIEAAIKIASPYFLWDPESKQHTLDDAVLICELYNGTSNVYPSGIPTEWPVLHGSQTLLDFLAVSAYREPNFAFIQSVSRMQPGEISRLLSLLISAVSASLVNSDTLALALLPKVTMVDLPDGTGATALMLAADVDHCELIDRLLNVGASVSAEDSQGRTALSRACQAGHVRAANALLESGSDVSHRDHDGLTCVQLAEKFGHSELLQLLNRNPV